MNKAKKTFLYCSLGVAIVALGVFLLTGRTEPQPDSLPTTKYGAFLAAQHAVYVNDFASASKFGQIFKDVENSSVRNLRVLSEFLNGQLSDDVSEFKDDKTIPMRTIYDVFLINNNKWEELYNRHSKDSSGVFAAFRVWPGIAIKHKTEVLKFVEESQTNSGWKSFVRGQIYAELGDYDEAVKCFQTVTTDFLNINDYLYLMSFYQGHGFNDSAAALKQAFTSSPGGMYMVNFSDIPDWSVYSGYKNQMAFSLLQTVSHTQVMTYSDLSLVLLRSAQMIAPQQNSDALDYYLGLFMFNNRGDFAKLFTNIKGDSPFYPFALTKMAGNDIKQINQVLKNYPAFVPALQKIVNYHIAHGNKRTALKMVNRALKQDGINDGVRAFFTKMRAHIYCVFGDYKRAQSDLRFASGITGVDSDVLALQAKIWVAENRDIDTAYEYAMKMVTTNPTDVFAWDVLGRVVYAREGVDAALEIVQGVGDVANNCSSLFDNLGNLYYEIGDFESARKAYERAIDLSDDGMIIVPNTEKKLRKLK